MPNTITKKFKLVNAKNFMDTLSESSGNSLYMFLSRPNKWEDDTVPDTPLDSQKDVARTWDEMISLKKISSENIINVVKRKDWTAQEIYAEYDNEDVNLFDKNFYVLNREFNVYKCIDNAGNSKSLVEPTGTSLDIFTTSDGYRWKFLYNIPTAEKLKFLTTNWMPVIKDENVAANAIDGAIENIKIYNGGVDYSPSAAVVIEGDGRNATIIPRRSLGVIYDFAYTNVGISYHYANAYITDSNGFGRLANIKAIISPPGGHGNDPVSELGAHFVMINSKAEYNEGYGDFPQNFTFRQIGIVRNPLSSANVTAYSLPSIATSETLNALNGLTLKEITGTFTQGEFAVGLTTGANAYVVASNVASGNGYVKYIQSYGLTSNYKNFAVGEIIIGKTSGATANVSNLIYSEIIQDNGDILYLENKTPITRRLDQTDNLHLVIEF